MARRPIFWFAVSYAAGVCLQARLGLPLWVPVAAACPVVLLCTWRPWARAGAALVCAAASGLALGYAACGMRALPTSPESLGVADGDGVTLSGHVLKPLPSGKPAGRFVVEVETVATGDGEACPASGNVMVTGRFPAGLSVGQRVWLSGDIESTDQALNPGEFDTGGYYAVKWDAAAMIGADVIQSRPSHTWSLSRALAKFRFRLRDELLDCMPRANPTLTTDLLLSTVIGLRAVDLPRDIEDDFRRAGTIHVLVVSGSQVALLTALVLALTRRAGRLRWLMNGLSIVVVAGYALLVGPEPSIARAALMGGIATVAFALRREHDVGAALAAAACMLMLADPAAVFDIGFQLSVVCVIAIIHFIPQRTRVVGPGRLPSVSPRPKVTLWGAAWVAFRVSVAVWLLVTPLLLHHFRQASLISALANLIVVPIACALTVLGMLAAGLVWVLPGWAYCLNSINSLLVEWMVRVTSAFADVPWAQLRSSGFSWIHVAAWWGVVLIGDHLIRRARARMALRPSDG